MSVRILCEIDSRPHYPKFVTHVARQSVVDRMVREISLEVREKSGESHGKVREFIFTFLVETLMYILTSVQHILK